MLSERLFGNQVLRMSDPIVKGVKRSPSRLTSRQNSTASARKGTFAAKTARPKPIVKRSKSEKAPARKAHKSTTKQSSSSSVKAKATKLAPPARKASPQKKTAASKNKPKAVAHKPVPVKKPKKAAPSKAAKARPVPAKQLKQAK